MVRFITNKIATGTTVAVMDAQARLCRLCSGESDSFGIC